MIHGEINKSNMRNHFQRTNIMAFSAFLLVFYPKERPTPRKDRPQGKTIFVTPLGASFKHMMIKPNIHI